MIKRSLNFLEDYLNDNINEKYVKDAIDFNLFQSMFIENQDNNFTFKDKVEFSFNILKMEKSKIYNLILDNILYREIDISARNLS